VAEQVDLKTLFQLPPAETQHLIETGKAVLDTWSEVYLQVRRQAVLPMTNQGPCATNPGAETDFALWAGLLFKEKKQGLGWTEVEGVIDCPFANLEPPSDLVEGTKQASTSCL
jgi:hypothetical protein